jgi:hypothetical protein
VSERATFKPCAADGSYLKRPIGDEPLSEVFGSIRFTAAEARAIRREAARDGSTFGQVIRKYCVLALPKP